MIITKEVLDQIEPGEIFKVVTTRVQRFHEPMTATLKFVCVKGNAGIDWAIYAGLTDQPGMDIQRHGDKVHSEDIIKSICPCDDAVFEMYRH